MSLPALQSTISDIIDEYHQKCDGAETAIASMSEAITALGHASTVQGVYVEAIAPRFSTGVYAIQKNLLKSAWKALYARLPVDRIASAEDKKRIDMMLSDPPALTMENIRDRFGKYLLDPRHHILKGLAQVFTSLDPAYRSHSKVKIGVKGLPKRVILTYWGSYSSYGRDKLRDIVNALAAYRGEPLMYREEFDVINQTHKAGEDAVLSRREIKDYQRNQLILPDRGLTIRAFQNGNAHVFFDKQACIDINMALHEFYGECLPDAEPDDVKPSASTAVSKDLQFYWSPPDVVSKLCDEADLTRWRDGPALRCLEPSCGDGRIMDALIAKGCDAFGVEYHPERAKAARAKGHNVMTANFLETVPTGDFDRVVMNPPFAGRHYLKHLRHALKFLKPDGVLVSVLPATAWYDHGELSGDLAGKWIDLPVASFSEAGTNVPTGILKVKK